MELDFNAISEKSELMLYNPSIIKIPDTVSAFHGFGSCTTGIAGSGIENIYFVLDGLTECNRHNIAVSEIYKDYKTYDENLILPHKNGLVFEFAADNLSGITGLWLTDGYSFVN